MPMIQLTLPAGVLTADTRRDLQNALAATLLKWEGAPDTAFFRAQAWSRVDEVSGDGFTALEDDAPRFRLDVTVPDGALSQRRKDGLVKESTEHVLAAAGLTDADALRVWVLIHERAEGTWGAGGGIVRYAELVAFAQQSRETKADA
jgi:phenylpyruvate tautomerase PptA (4-oxalocrotonate tautomerase family)